MQFYMRIQVHGKTGRASSILEMSMKQFRVDLYVYPVCFLLTSFISEKSLCNSRQLNSEQKYEKEEPLRRVMAKHVIINITYGLISWVI